jgi:SAM-dependent methyltransferase
MTPQQWTPPPSTGSMRPGWSSRRCTIYALLPRPSANRVYGATSLDLTRAELEFLDQHVLGRVIGEQTVTSLGGVEYLRFDCPDRSLDAFQVEVISNLSTLQALFTVEGPLLRPVTVRPRLRYDDDITTIQRYVGKTNEQFTRLLMNVTLAASGDGYRRLLGGEPVRLLDPLCGRGTTLNQAVVYGIDAYGVEIDRKDFEAYAQFIVTWLQNKRIKHKVERAKLRRGRTTPAQRLSITYGPPADPRRPRIDVVNDDTVTAVEHFKERSMDLIVADLPYGVQHETRPGDGRISRHPDELLKRALPVWRRLLRPRGAIGLAWNLHTLDRARLFELAIDAGFAPCQSDDDPAFQHRVDQAITRDLVVATKDADR